MKITDKITITNEDNMVMMARYPDKYFDLAIVDPPYFDGPQKPGYYAGTKQKTKVGNYKTLDKSWGIPDKKYFEELNRVSKNQIIWGINYFDVAMPGGRIVWIKGEQGSPFSMADIAYHSFYNRIDLFKHTWSGFRQEKGLEKEVRIHPTQKPVQLYRWILDKYAKPDYKILDTHLGSGSIALACHDYGFELTACELDSDYYKSAIERIQNHVSQLTLF